MSKIKLKLFIKELPSGKVIPLASKSYVITKYDQSVNDFNKERAQAVMGMPSTKDFESQDVKKRLEELSKNPNKFTVPQKKEANHQLFPFKEQIAKNYNARSAKTDVNGFTEEMNLPIGKYAIWITDNGVQNKIARIGHQTLLHGFEVIKDVQGLTSLDIQIKQYYCYQLIDAVTRKPLPNVKFNLYSLDNQNKPKKLNRTDIKMSITNKNGLTPLLYSTTGEIIFVGFERGGIERFAPVNSLKSYAVFSPKNFHTIEWPAVKVSTEKPVGTKANLQQVSKVPILFNFQTCESCVLSPEDFAKFEKESRQLDTVIYESFLRKKQLDDAIANGASRSEIEKLEKEIAEMEKKVAEHLNQNYKTKADLVELFVATSYKTEGSKEIKNGFTRRYIKLKSYENNYKAKRLNLASFKIDNLSKGLAQSVKNKEISPELKKAGFDELKKIETTLLKQEWYKKEGYIDLPGMGDSFYQEAKHSDSFESTADAQWLRAVGGAGASGSVNWNPVKGDIGVKVQATAQGKLILAEMGYKATLCIPSRTGVSLKYHDIYLGALRATVFGDVTAFVGAKAAIGFGMNLGYNAKGEPELTGDGIVRPQASIAENYDSTNKRPTFVVAKEDEKFGSQKGLNADSKIGVDAFAGVEGGIKVGAGLEWLSPESKKFENIASVAPKVTAQFGVGAGYNFEIQLIKGQFRIKAKASLCLGAGAKGELELAVGADKLVEFNKCLAYQLRQNGTKLLPYIADDAFEYWQKIQVYSILKGISIIYVSIGILDEKIDNLITDFKTAKDLKKLAENINKSNNFLLYATPETRGMLLFMLMADTQFSNVFDRLEINTTTKEVHFLPERKQAILTIFRSIMTKSAWDNTLQHMTADGHKASQSIAWLESRVIFFLNNGQFLANQNEVNDAISEGRSCISPPQTGNSLLDEYIQLRCKLVQNVPLGQVMLANNTADYEILANDLDLANTENDLLLAQDLDLASPLGEPNDRNKVYMA